MDSATEVRYGGVVVGRSPLLRDRTDTGAFVVFGEPLPVGTAVVLKIEEKEQHARVTEVVESADASAAGMRVKFVSAAERAAPPPAREPAPAPAPAREPAAPVAAATTPEAGSAPVPVAVGERGSEGSSSASAGVPSSEGSAAHGGDSHGHHDGEHGRRKRRRR